MSALDFTGLNPEQEAAIREDMAAGLTFGPQRFTPADIVGYLDQIAELVGHLSMFVAELAAAGQLPDAFDIALRHKENQP